MIFPTVSIQNTKLIEENGGCQWYIKKVTDFKISSI